MKNVATVKFTEVVDGKAMQHHLCRDCFDSCQRDAAGFSVDVPKPGARSGKRQPVATRSESAPRCLSCGTSLNRIFESAEVGCPSCYSTYGKEIESILEALQRGLAHRGKVFKCDDARAKLSVELQAKRMLLRSVLKAENYEEAARLRDEIAKMEAEVQSADAASNTGG